jgi:hypothetical protein
MNSLQAAQILYDNYCTEVGGKAFNGEPLPDWQTFYNDPSKSKQAHAWERAANALLNAQQIEGAPAQFHIMAVLEDASMLCNKIEELPASEKQTSLSIAAAELRRQISDLIS